MRTFRVWTGGAETVLVKGDTLDVSDDGVLRVLTEHGGLEAAFARDCWMHVSPDETPTGSSDPA